METKFYFHKAERQLAETTRQAIVDEFPKQTVVTPILPQSTFYPIKGKEAGHQNYYKKKPYGITSTAIAVGAIKA